MPSFIFHAHAKLLRLCGRARVDSAVPTAAQINTEALGCAHPRQTVAA